MEKTEFMSKNKKYLIISIFILMAYLAPYLILGEDVSIRIHDNLDSEITWFKLLVESGENFSFNSIIPNIMNNVSRLSYQTEFNFYHLLYYLGPLNAYCINKILMVFFGFFSMVILLKTHFRVVDMPLFVLYGCSICFAILPLWSSGGLTIPAFPLILWSFINIYKNINVKMSFIIIITIPLYSDFVRFYVFFLIVLFCWLAWDYIKHRRFNTKIGVAGFMMLFIFLLIEYRLVYLLIEKPFISHREVFNYVKLGSTDSFYKLIPKIIKNFVFGHYHVTTNHTFIVLPIVVSALIYLLKKRKHKTFKAKLQYCLLLFVFLGSFCYGLFYTTFFQVIYSQLPVISHLKISRFHWFHPFLWYLLFAISSSVIWSIGKNGKRVVEMAIVIQLLLLFAVSEQYKGLLLNQISYAEFYATDHFSLLKKHINHKNKYKAITLGMHPSILQFNGIHTLDGYMNNYPLKYKNQFFKIIQAELSKNQQLYKYFNYWGSRCYLFSSELGKKYLLTKDKRKHITNLCLDVRQISKMGGRYIISAVKIKNYSVLGLKHVVKGSTNKYSPWEIEVYAIND